MNERDFQRKVVKLAVAEGWRVHHAQASKPFPAGKGFPDLFFAKIPDRVMAMELKGDGGEAGDEQHLWLSILEKAGIPSYLFWPENYGEIAWLLKK